MQYEIIVGPGLCECGCGQAARRRFALGHKPGDGPISFWEKVPLHLGIDDCWKWAGVTNQTGYGLWGGASAHRLVYEYFCGPIPPDLQACHRCDNPPCVNPCHIFIGTALDNMQDMARKGRSGRPRVTLTQADVTEIRRLYVAGLRPNRVLAQRFGVSTQQIQRIVTGRQWKS